MSVELVVARFNENLNWLRKVPKNFKITIYNKGSNNIPYKFIKIPNVGRESNTYLHHIIKNYNNLSKTTIFVQGDPFDHCPHLLILLEYINKFEKMQPLNSTLDINEKLRDLSYNIIQKIKIHIDYANNNFMPCYPTYWYNMNMEKYISEIKNLYNTENILKYYLKKLNFREFDPKYLIPINYAAIFSVDKSLILKNSLNFYKNMNKVLLNTKEFDLGYIYERLWLIIFYYHKYNSNYKKLLLSKYQLKDKIIYPKKELLINIPIFYNWLIYIILDNKDEYELGIYKSHLKLKINHKKLRIKFKNNIKNSFIFKTKKLKYHIQLQLHEHKINLPQNTKIQKIIFKNYLFYNIDLSNKLNI